MLDGTTFYYEDAWPDLAAWLLGCSLRNDDEL